MAAASSSMARKKSRNICFTQFITPMEFFEYWQLCDLPSQVEYIVYQFEECPETKRDHIQGYIEFNCPMAWSSILNLPHFGGAHLEARKGTGKQASDYCKKMESRKWGDPVERGTMKQQGKRSDLEAIAVRVRDGASLHDIAMDDPQAIVKWSRGLQVLQHLCDAPKMRAAPKISFYYGPPGTGKSLLAHNLNSTAYCASETKEGWMDGYTGQACIIFDDFKGIYPYGLMLKLLDRYPLRLPYKGGWLTIKATYFVFTSNDPPMLFYNGDPAWQRRLREFGEIYTQEMYMPDARELLKSIEDAGEGRDEQSEQHEEPDAQE